MAPTLRSFSGEFEPLDLIAQYPDRYPGLLESGASASSGSRFDILPMGNGECLHLDSAARLTGPYAAGSGGFLQAMHHWWSALQSPPEDRAPLASHGARPGGGVPRDGAAPPRGGLPFTGGWFLYLGYEIAAEVEPRLRLPASPDPTVALSFRAPAAWIRDRATMNAWLIAEPGHEALLDAFDRHVRDLRAGAVQAAEPTLIHIDIQEEDAGYFLRSVARALDYIAAGDIYQANLSRQWRGIATAPIDPISLYKRLRAANPGPFAAVLRHRDFSVLCSSPERLLAIRDGVAATRPIAGTRPRGASPERDIAMIDSLLGNEKERAEHVMLIDLERNDLGRVCVGGSVEVDEYMSVESYAHVHHLVSNVRGRLPQGISPVAVIRALFPGGTITGVPKFRCMEIIAELEGVGRGAYTGSIGYLNRDGSGDLNILIRTIAAGRSGLRFRAGAGIVADSDPAQELAETRAKAEGLLRAVRGPA